MTEMLRQKVYESSSTQIRMLSGWLACRAQYREFIERKQDASKEGSPVCHDTDALVEAEPREPSNEICGIR